jgi:hypothetical protein
VRDSIPFPRAAFPPSFSGNRSLFHFRYGLSQPFSKYFESANLIPLHRPVAFSPYLLAFSIDGDIDNEGGRFSLPIARGIDIYCTQVISKGGSYPAFSGKDLGSSQRSTFPDLVGGRSRRLDFFSWEVRSFTNPLACVLLLGAFFLFLCLRVDSWMYSFSSVCDDLTVVRDLLVVVVSWPP